jgi:hypothetical protein
MSLQWNGGSRRQAEGNPEALALRARLQLARSLLELGTFDMFDTLATRRPEEASREALRVGALSTAEGDP